MLLHLHIITSILKLRVRRRTVVLRASDASSPGFHFDPARGRLGLSHESLEPRSDSRAVRVHWPGQLEVRRRLSLSPATREAAPAKPEAGPGTIMIMARCSRAKSWPVSEVHCQVQAPWDSVSPGPGPGRAGRARSEIFKLSLGRAGGGPGHAAGRLGQQCPA